jgi:hypothetical protein
MYIYMGILGIVFSLLYFQFDRIYCFSFDYKPFMLFSVLSQHSTKAPSNISSVDVTGIYILLFRTNSFRSQSRSPQITHSYIYFYVIY